jgi:ATP-binding cassette subfamily C (CFTR/MRP) protein 1
LFCKDELTRFTFLLDVTVAIYVGGPFMIPLVIVYCYMGVKLQRFNMSFSREITRLRSISSSPVVQTFSEGVSGSKTIRAYRVEENIIKNFMEAIDENQKNTIILIASKQWFGVRVQAISLIVIIPSVVLAV